MKLLIEMAQSKLEDTEKRQLNVTEKCSCLTEKVQELENKNAKLLMERKHMNPLLETSKKVIELESINKRLELNLTRLKGLIIDKDKRNECAEGQIQQTLVQKENMFEMTILEK